jgi:hypothetical protein
VEPAQRLAGVQVGNHVAVTFYGDDAPEFVAVVTFADGHVVRAQCGTSACPGPHCDARFRVTDGGRIWRGLDDGGCFARLATIAEIAAHRERYGEPAQIAGKEAANG